MRYEKIRHYDITQYVRHRDAIDELMPYWTWCVREKLPVEYSRTLTNEEIESELIFACLYLSDRYRYKDYIGYCFRFAVKKTLNALYDDYNRMRITESVEVPESAVERQIEKVDMDRYFQEEQEREIRERIRNVMGDATGEDRKIMEAILEGKTITDIAKDMGKSHQAISKRLRRYSNQARAAW